MKNQTTPPSPLTFHFDAARRRASKLGRASCLALLVLCALYPALAQSQRADDGQTTSPPPTVMAAATTRGARFVAPNSVVEMRLEVFAQTGEKVFDSEFRRGSVLDWDLSGAQPAGAHDAAVGPYLCVVTLRDLSGGLRQRRGFASVQDGAVALRAATRAELSGAQSQAWAASRKTQALGSLAPGGEGVALNDDRSVALDDDEGVALNIVSEQEARAMTVAAHDGHAGQVTSTTGALTFRTGDVLTGREQEQMRITPEGRVGIGTDRPEAALDVVGALRVSEGIRFADGTTLNSAGGGRTAHGGAGDGSPMLKAAGTGTINRLPKWLETGGAGTLGDSVLTESASGFIGVGTTSPLYPLHVSHATFAQAYVAGGTAADFLMSHTNAPANARFMGLRSQDGKGKVSSFNDNSTYRHEAIIAWDNATGDVGVGTLSPAAKLDVVGTLRASSNLTVDTNTLFVDATNNRVGIGTTTPGVPLDVVGNINSSTQYNLKGQRILSDNGTNLYVGAGAGAVHSIGTGNSFFGTNAGLSAVNAFNNSFFGSNAGAANTTSANSFFGSSAGAATTTGSSNAFFGKDAGAANITGSSNSFFGSGAGAANTAHSNSFFGKDSGAANTTGTGNAFFGTLTGYVNTTGYYNSFFGYGVGGSNTTGLSNSFFGHGAGSANTTGSSNTFVGSGAGSANTTGGSNTFVGLHAGLSNTTAILNSFFGTQAGRANTTGTGNAFFGALAGYANSTGSHNAFFGYTAGDGNLGGSFNAFFGSGAGGNNLTASDNSFFGYRAGNANTSGISNSFFGKEAGVANTTASDNAFFGDSAGVANTEGASNSFIGTGAGAANTTGGSNTFVGRSAGLSNTTEDDNTFLGANSNGAAGITNATAVGANAVVTQSDSLVLGSGVNVGIGTNAPAEKLHVRGHIYISGGGPFANNYNGLILKSPDTLTCAKLTISNAGALVTTIIPCP